MVLIHKLSINEPDSVIFCQSPLVIYETRVSGQSQRSNDQFLINVVTKCKII